MVSNDFIDPLSDFGFKNVFGKDGKAKENLIVLLNAILHEQMGFEKIVDLKLNPTEQKGVNPEYKSSQYDIHCITDNGHRIIVEMQKRKERNFDNRLLFYVAQSVINQGINVIENQTCRYDFDPVVGLAICNFTLPSFDNRKLAYFNLRDVFTNIKYGDQLSLVFVHLPEFSQNEEECKSELDKIIYSLRNMKTIQETKHNPFSKKEGDFYDTIALMSRLSALSPEEREQYFAWAIHENDRKLREIYVREDALAEGLKEGEEIGRIEEKWSLARNAKRMGLPLPQISELTGLSMEELETLNHETNI